MAHITPQVRDGLLTYHADRQEASIPIESAAWWHWLADETTTTFHFQSPQGSFTARREQKSNGHYWYAYRKLHGKLRKAYLGKAEELSLPRLDTVAATLAEQEQATRHRLVNSNTTLQAEQSIQSAHEESRVAHLLPLTPQPLLNTKLFLPPSRAGLVPRPQLLVRLDEVLQHKLTLISAPAGFGKTTLLSTWCKIRSRTSSSTRSLAWLSLDAGDNDPIRFWTYVTAALQRLCPELGEQVLPMLQAAPLPSLETPIEAILTVLINTLDGFEHDILLILDDYHIITTQTIHDALAFLIDHLPAHVHLILASRSEPPLPLVCWRARGQLNELHTSDLRFNSDEVTIFLKEAMGLDLSHQEIAVLDTHTEGWIAGLQLAALSMQGRTDIEAFIATFTGSHRYILDYLTSEVLNRQPAPMRDFLLQTSILERLNASLCNAVTERQDGQEMLERLEQANLFLIALDEKRQWYRYHQLFAEFLRDRLRQTHPDLVPQLHKRACTWYEHYGLISATIDHALAASDTELVAQLAERFCATMIMRGEIVTFLRWLEALPKAVVNSHPHLRIYQAGSLVSIGHLDTAKTLLQDIARTLQQMKSVQEQGQQQSDIQILEGEFYSVSVALAGMRGDVPHTIELAHKALVALPEENVSTRSMVVISLGNAYLLSGDLEKAEETFSEAFELGEASQNRLVSLSSLTGLGYIQVARGQLHQAAETYRKAISLGTRQGGRLFSVVGMTYAFFGQVLCEWNNLDEAERYTRDGIEVGQRWGYIGALAQGYNMLANIQVARDNIGEALALMRQTNQMVRGYTLPYVIRLTAAYAAWVELLAGNITIAAQWAQSSGLSESDTFTYPHELEHLILIQILIAQDKLTPASRIVERLLPAAEAAGRMHTVIDCLILQSIIQHKKGQQDEALATLAHALTLAEPEGYVRLFLDKGEAVIALLRQIATRGIMTPKVQIYAHKLLTASPGTASSVSDLLSERELDVLKRIADGKSNQQIAAELVVALSTVKTHINNIYARLGVHSRTQAVARAKALGLLP